MAGRYFGPARLELSGSGADRYIGLGRKQMGAMLEFMRLNGLKQLVWRRGYRGSVRVETRVAGPVKAIRVSTVANPPQVKGPRKTGFRVTYDGAPAGVNVLAYRSPGWELERFDELQTGSRATWAGDYYVLKTDSYNIYQYGRKTLGSPEGREINGILEYDGTVYVVCVNSAFNVSFLRVFARENGAWVLKGLQTVVTSSSVPVRPSPSDVFVGTKTSGKFVLSLTYGSLGAMILTVFELSVYPSVTLAEPVTYYSDPMGSNILMTVQNNANSSNVLEYTEDIEGNTDTWVSAPSGSGTRDCEEVVLTWYHSAVVAGDSIRILYLELRYEYHGEETFSGNRNVVRVRNEYTIISNSGSFAHSGTASYRLALTFGDSENRMDIMRVERDVTATASCSEAPSRTDSVVYNSGNFFFPDQPTGEKTNLIVHSLSEGAGASDTTHRLIDMRDWSTLAEVVEPGRFDNGLESGYSLYGPSMPITSMATGSSGAQDLSLARMACCPAYEQYNGLVTFSHSLTHPQDFLLFFGEAIPKFVFFEQFGGEVKVYPFEGVAGRGVANSVLYYLKFYATLQTVAEVTDGDLEDLLGAPVPRITEIATF